MKPAYGPEGWRKLIACIAGLFCVSLLALKGQLDATSGGFLLALVSLYLTGNVVSKFTAPKQ